MPDRREVGTQRLSRLLEIYLLIATTPRHWTRGRLAARYELSERQVQKDIDEIRHRLNPSLKRTLAGYWFERSPVLGPVTYSVAEALTLLRAARAGAMIAGIDARELAAALGRLEAVLPTELRTLLPAPSQPAGAGSARGERLQALELALAGRQRVRLTYAAAAHGGAVTERLVDVYAIAPYLRSWHAIGYCHLRQDVRTFKVDRIMAIEATEECYVVPAGFDVAAYLGRGEAWGAMVGEGGEPVRVVLRFSPLAARWVGEEMWHPSQRVEPLSDGGIMLHLRVAITPELHRWVFHYGREVEVVEPEALRAWVRDEAGAILSRAAGEPGRGC